MKIPETRRGKEETFQETFVKKYKLFLDHMFRTLISRCLYLRTTGTGRRGIFESINERKDKICESPSKTDYQVTAVYAYDCDFLCDYTGDNNLRNLNWPVRVANDSHIGEMGIIRKFLVRNNHKP